MKEKHPKTVAELKKVATEEWEKISIEDIQATFKHMLKVYPWVVRNDGNE